MKFLAILALVSTISAVDLIDGAGDCTNDAVTTAKTDVETA